VKLYRTTMGAFVEEDDPSILFRRQTGTSLSPALIYMSEFGWPLVSRQQNSITHLFSLPWSARRCGPQA
jgi:hypothetical protein